MVPCATALALCLALLLACPTHGEEQKCPHRVRFTAEVARHLLRWERGQSCPSNTSYDVEYKVYGSNTSWTTIPECWRTSEHSCDLTYYTLNPEQRYFARVRAVSGNHHSSWKRSSSFSPQEAGLRLAGQSLSVLGNSIQVRLQLLLHAGNVTVELSHLQRNMARYLVHVRRTWDNHTLTVLEKSMEFTIRDLFWVTEYCLSVEPSMANRPVLSTRSDEQCVTTGPRDRSAELLPDILSSCLILLLLLGLLAALLARTYIRRPVRTPSVLKSFMKQSSLWLEHDPPPSGSLDADPVQQLFLCQKEPQLGSSSSSSSSSSRTAPLAPEQSCELPAWPKDLLCLLGPAGSRDSSSTSTDSGICLHAPSSSSSSSSSSSLSCSAGPEPQGYRRQLPRAEDSGVGLERPCPAPALSSSCGSAGPGEPQLPPSSQDGVEFRGYLQQAKGSVGPGQVLDQGMPLLGCAGSVQGLGSTDTVLGMEGPELAVSKGYLKQSCPQHPLTQDLAPWAAPAWPFSSQVGPQAPTLLSWAAPGAALASKGSPDLKTPLDLGIFSSPDFLGMLSLLPSLSPDWISLPMQPLRQLSGDSKDSRL